MQSNYEVHIEGRSSQTFATAAEAVAWIRDHFYVDHVTAIQTEERLRAGQSVSLSYGSHSATAFWNGPTVQDALKSAIAAMERVKPQAMGALVVQDLEHALALCQQVLEPRP